MFLAPQMLLNRRRLLELPEVAEQFLMEPEVEDVLLSEVVAVPEAVQPRLLQQTVLEARTALYLCLLKNRRLGLVVTRLKLRS